MLHTGPAAGACALARRNPMRAVACGGCTERHIPDETADTRSSRREELAAFIVLAVLIWPIIAVGFVGAYKFATWVWQMIFCPPGPPG